MFRPSLNRIGRNAVAHPPARHGASRPETYLRKRVSEWNIFWWDPFTQQDRALAPEQKIAATSDAIVLFLRCLSGAFFPNVFFLWTGLNITRFTSHRHYPSTNQTVPVRDCKISCTIPPKHNSSLSQTTCQGPRAKRWPNLLRPIPQEPWGTTRHYAIWCNLNSLSWF